MSIPESLAAVATFIAQTTGPTTQRARPQWTDLLTSPIVPLVLVMVVAFGFAFEFPLLVVFLLLARIVETRQLRQWRRYTFLGIVVIAAVITPSQDPITLFALAIPMYILYEGAIIVGRLMRR